VGHKVNVDNFFSWPYLFDNIHTHITMCHETVWPNRTHETMVGKLDSHSMEQQTCHNVGVRVDDSVVIVCRLARIELIKALFIPCTDSCAGLPGTWPVSHLTMFTSAVWSP
jgi:hypothetical protein